ELAPACLQRKLAGAREWGALHQSGATAPDSKSASRQPSVILKPGLGGSISNGRTTACKAKGAKVFRAPHRDCGRQGVPGKLAAFRREPVGRITVRRPGEYAGDAPRSSPTAGRRALRPEVLQPGRVRDGGNPGRDSSPDCRQ